MGCLHPELLLVGIPVLLLWWKLRGQGTVTDALRLLVALLLVLALSGVYLETGGEGRDLVVVVDRSRSMPAGAEASARELIALAEEARGEGDSVHVVGFGSEAVIAHATLGDARFSGFEQAVDADGSDLGAALETALNLIEEGRRGSLLLVSDGENNGRAPIPVARRAFGRGVRIDVRGTPRPGTADLAVERFDLPGEVAVGEPFQFNVWVRADRRVESELVLRRGEKLLSSGARTFEAGLNRVLFRDALERPGIAEYEVSLGLAEDRIPENNRGLGAVRASGAPAVLVLNHDGNEDSLVSALRAARLPVAVTRPEAARLDAVGLSGFRAVVLENVAASRLGRAGLDALRDHVLDRGAGLLVTGGGASFGIGGYYLSPVDAVLPVTMELRQEHRKLSVALAVSLDRSGSMQAPVGGGMTKMDLANLGTVAAIELLSPMDAVAVIAVDSSHHVIQPLIPVADKQQLTKRVRRIASMGGGIFTYTALVAAARELKEAQQLNRHIILFADAADAEEQEQCPDFVRELKQRGVTLSVIALGTESDPDAAFLKSIAGIGGGEAYFTNDPSELPRLFAMDTMTMARSTFVDEPTPVSVLPDLFGVGAMPAERFPTLAGYNLTYLRPGAQAGLVSADDYRAPLFAFMHQGLGRSAAYTGQIGGSHGADVVAWDGFATFFTTAVRWLLGNEEPEAFFTRVRREGKDAVLTVEVDPEAPLPPDTADLTARIGGADGARTELVLERRGEFFYEARYPLEREGISVGTVALGEDRFVSLPPIVLPYSPEFEHSPDPDRGERLLRRIARESGGQVGVVAADLFRGERQGRLWRLITRELMLAALLLLLVEIAGRRLSLWGSIRFLSIVRRVSVRIASRAAELRAERPISRSPSIPADSRSEPGEMEKARSAPERPPASEGVASALTRARQAAKRKLDR